MISFSVLFFNDTATTEIYTYEHSRSLRDARPIYGQIFAPCCTAVASSLPVIRKPPSPMKPTTGRSGWRSAARSEEHTSELQSLMRISYAVFCLQKKNTKLHTQLQATNKPHHH